MHAVSSAGLRAAMLITNLRHLYVRRHKRINIENRVLCPWALSEGMSTRSLVLFKHMIESYLSAVCNKCNFNFQKNLINKCQQTRDKNARNSSLFQVYTCAMCEWYAVNCDGKWFTVRLDFTPAAITIRAWSPAALQALRWFSDDAYITVSTYRTPQLLRLNKQKGRKKNSWI